MQLGGQHFLSGSWVWYSATIAGDKVRLSAYSTTSLFGGAQQHANGRVFVGFAVVAVQGFEVKIEFAEVFWLKRCHLEFYRHQAVQATVEEQQIEREGLIADLHRVFGADVAEVAAQLGQKTPQVLHQ